MADKDVLANVLSRILVLSLCEIDEPDKRGSGFAPRIFTRRVARSVLVALLVAVVGPNLVGDGAEVSGLPTSRSSFDVAALEAKVDI